FDPTELFMLRIGSGDDSSTRSRRGHDSPVPENTAGNGETTDDEHIDEEDDDFDDAEIFHPLASGSEAHYQFRTGEETTIRLQDGGLIRLIELQILPRRSSSRLLRGSFWLEAGSYRPVRGVFTLASPLTVRGPPRGSRAPLPSLTASFEIRHV